MGKETLSVEVTKAAMVLRRKNGAGGAVKQYMRYSLPCLGPELSVMVEVKFARYK